MAEKKTSSPRIRRTTILTGVTYAPVFFYTYKRAFSHAKFFENRAKNNFR